MAAFEVFIGNVALFCKDGDMKRLFEKTEGLSTPVSIRINKRFAFVGFRDRRTAEDAVRKLHGTHFMGDILRVEMGRSVGKSQFSKRLNHTCSLRRSPTQTARSNFNNDVRSENFLSESATFLDHQRPHSVSDFERESSRYPYGDPPAYRGTNFPPQSYLSYSGYPIVHCYESVNRYRPIGELQPSNLSISLQPRPDVYDPCRRCSPELSVPCSDQSRSIDGGGDAGRCSVRDSYPPYHALAPSIKYELGRYGSRFPVESQRSYRGGRS